MGKEIFVEKLGASRHSFSFVHSNRIFPKFIPVHSFRLRVFFMKIRNAGFSFLFFLSRDHAPSVAGHVPCMIFFCGGAVQSREAFGVLPRVS